MRNGSGRVPRRQIIFSYRIPDPKFKTRPMVFWEDEKNVKKMAFFDLREGRNETMAMKSS